MVRIGAGECGCGLAQGPPRSKCLKRLCKVLGQVWEEGALEDRNPGEMQPRQWWLVVEVVPFCHRNICFNMLCFFPDWNHLNCVY